MMDVHQYDELAESAIKGDAMTESARAYEPDGDASVKAITEELPDVWVVIMSKPAWALGPAHIGTIIMCNSEADADEHVVMLRVKYRNTEWYFNAVRYVPVAF